MLDATSKKNPRPLEWAGMIGLKTGLALHQERGAFGGVGFLHRHFLGAAGIAGGFGLFRATGGFRAIASLRIARLRGRDKGESSQA